MWVFIVNGLAYVVWSVASRHLSRDLAPTRADLGSIWQSIKDHVRFQHPARRRGEAVQRAAEADVSERDLRVVAARDPDGICDVAVARMRCCPGWVDLFGGRQSARTLHFVAALALVAFTALHVFLVITTGLWNNMRSMIERALSHRCRSGR